MNSFEEMCALLEEIVTPFKKPNKKHHSDKRVSFHEAGHAFIQLYYGIPPIKATIIPKNGALGYIIPGHTRIQYKDRNGEKKINYNNYDIDDYLYQTDKFLEIDTFFFLNISMYSGTMADLLYSGKLETNGFGSDCAQLFNKYSEYGMHGFGINGVGTYVDYTIKMLKKNWENVTQIANDLYEKKTLKESYFNRQLKTMTIFKIPPLKEVWDFY